MALLQHSVNPLDRRMSNAFRMQGRQLASILRQGLNSGRFSRSQASSQKSIVLLDINCYGGCGRTFRSFTVTHPAFTSGIWKAQIHMEAVVLTTRVQTKHVEQMCCKKIALFIAKRPHAAICLISILQISSKIFLLLLTRLIIYDTLDPHKALPLKMPVGDSAGSVPD